MAGTKARGQSLPTDIRPTENTDAPAKYACVQDERSYLELFPLLGLLSKAQPAVRMGSGTLRRETEWSTGPF